MWPQEAKAGAKVLVARDWKVNLRSTFVNREYSNGLSGNAQAPRYRCFNQASAEQRRLSRAHLCELGDGAKTEFFRGPRRREALSGGRSPAETIRHHAHDASIGGHGDGGIPGSRREIHLARKTRAHDTRYGYGLQFGIGVAAS